MSESNEWKKRANESMKMLCNINGFDYEMPWENCGKLKVKDDRRREEENGIENDIEDESGKKSVWEIKKKVFYSVNWVVGVLDHVLFLDSILFHL